MEDQSKRDRTRDALLESLPKGGVVAEIGVWEGGFSSRILHICAPRELHLIDPWLYLPAFSNTGFGKKKNAHLMEARYHAVCAKFADDPRVKVHRMTSEVGLSQFEDHALDWVYLDGNHNFPFIDNDLTLSLRKVKRGGIIAGDDYYWEAQAGQTPVRHAVGAMLRADMALKVTGNQYRIDLALA